MITSHHAEVGTGWPGAGRG